MTANSNSNFQQIEDAEGGAEQSQPRITRKATSRGSLVVVVHVAPRLARLPR